MSAERIKSLLSELQKELNSSDVDPVTLSSATQLTQDVNDFLARPEQVTPLHPSILERANELEIGFARDHPVVEAVIREIVDILSKMGI